MSAGTFESLRIWHDARRLTARIYAVTRLASFSRDPVLRNQIRRAAVSVMSNIAEGHERGGLREFRRFLEIAKGSCAEMRSQLYTAEDVGYLDRSEASELRTLSAALSRSIDALSRSREIRAAAESRSRQ
jgi:four helix bundle protein